jgi:hypothetical protein
MKNLKNIMHWNFPNTIFLIFIILNAMNFLIIYGPLLKYLACHMEFWTNSLYNDIYKNNLLYFWLNAQKKIIIFIV